jgi:hypothetical protein
MRHAKIGDVFYVKVPNGYKLYQWAYTVRIGDLIRVFGGLYDTIPENIEEIVNRPHDYVIATEPKFLYRLKLAHLIGNFKVPEEYPEPEFDIGWAIASTGEVFRIYVRQTKSPWSEQRFEVSRMDELPIEYQNEKMARDIVSFDWLLYLFDTDWNLNRLEKFYPCEKINLYSDIFNRYYDQYRQERLQRKSKRNE